MVIGNHGKSGHESLFSSTIIHPLQCTGIPPLSDEKGKIKRLYRPFVSRDDSHPDQNARNYRPFHIQFPVQKKKKKWNLAPSGKSSFKSNRPTPPVIRSVSNPTKPSSLLPARMIFFSSRHRAAAFSIKSGLTKPRSTVFGAPLTGSTLRRPVPMGTWSYGDQ
jgi:hypothetical protein